MQYDTCKVHTHTRSTHTPCTCSFHWQSSLSHEHHLQFLYLILVLSEKSIFWILVDLWLVLDILSPVKTSVLTKTLSNAERMIDCPVQSRISNLLLSTSFHKAPPLFPLSPPSLTPSSPCLTCWHISVCSVFLRSCCLQGLHRQPSGSLCSLQGTTEGGVLV